MEKSPESPSQVLLRYKFIIENIKDVIWELNRNLYFTFVSPTIRNMTGHDPEDLTGRNLTEFLTEESKRIVIDKVTNGRENYQPGEKIIAPIEVQFTCKNGMIKWVEVTANPLFEEEDFVGYIGTTRDITEKKEYETRLNGYIRDLMIMNDKLKNMATVDVLTGTYNRRKFNDELNTIIRRTDRDTARFSLIFFDIDDFKMINDSYGHKSGDYLLRRISRLVKENIRETDDLYRWGGDEFVVILPEADLEGSKIVADKIRTIIQNYDFGIGQTLTISLGVGEYQGDENADQIISRLDKALFRAKSKGKNTVIAC